MSSGVLRGGAGAGGAGPVSGDILDQIDHALADRTVSPDAMRWTAVEPVSDDRAGFSSALREVERRLTPDRILKQRHQHLIRRIREADLMILWPQHWVSVDHREQFASGSTLLGLGLALAVIDRPLVVALPLAE